MKILVIGADGLLGKQLTQNLKKEKFLVYESTYAEHDITSYNSIKGIFADRDYNYVINCAAYTDVNNSESDRKKAYSVNAVGVGVLSKLCLENNFHLIHFSTDFVFSGKASTPYIECSPTSPVNFYGSSKEQGEKILLKHFKNMNSKNYTIFRLQWLYGNNPKTFFMKILEKAKMGYPLTIVDDELGSPCSVNFISNTVIDYIRVRSSVRRMGGIFHLTHDNWCSRYECSSYFLNKLKLQVPITAIRDVPSEVKRPKFGILSNKKLRNYFKVQALSTWEQDLDLFVKELKDNGLV